MLEIKEVGAMSERLQFGSNRAHDGDDETIIELIVDGADAVEAKHKISAISNWQIAISKIKNQKSEIKTRDHGGTNNSPTDPIILVPPTSACASAARRRDAGCCMPKFVRRQLWFRRAPDHLKTRNECPGLATAVRSLPHLASATDRARQNGRDR